MTLGPAGKTANLFHARVLEDKALADLKVARALAERNGTPLSFLFEQVRANGARVETRLGPTLEALGVSFSLSPESFESLEKSISREIEDEHQAVLTGTVGPLSARFKMTPNTVYADAVKSIPCPTEGTRSTYVLAPDTCWTSIQLFLRNGVLYPVLTARSVDLENGLTSDLLFWYRYLFKRFPYPLGRTTVNIGSLHLYI